MENSFYQSILNNRKFLSNREQCFNDMIEIRQIRQMVAFPKLSSCFLDCILDGILSSVYSIRQSTRHYKTTHIRSQKTF